MLLNTFSCNKKEKTSVKNQDGASSGEQICQGLDSKQSMKYKLYLEGNSPLSP